MASQPTDNVIVAREELNRKELMLKQRLLATKNSEMYCKRGRDMCGNNLTGKPKQQDVIADDVEIYNERPVTKWPVKPTVNPAEIGFNMIPKSKSSTGAIGGPKDRADDKMHSFLDEMRQQFLQT